MLNYLEYHSLTLYKVSQFYLKDYMMTFQGFVKAIKPDVNSFSVIIEMTATAVESDDGEFDGFSQFNTTDF